MCACPEDHYDPELRTLQPATQPMFTGVPTFDCAVAASDRNQYSCRSIVLSRRNHSPGAESMIEGGKKEGGPTVLDSEHAKKTAGHIFKNCCTAGRCRLRGTPQFAYSWPPPPCGSPLETRPSLGSLDLGAGIMFCWRKQGESGRLGETLDQILSAGHIRRYWA
jgi:hypothetical protein